MIVEDTTHSLKGPGDTRQMARTYNREKRDQRQVGKDEDGGEPDFLRSFDSNPASDI